MQHRTTLLWPSTLELQSVTGHSLKVLDKTQIPITGGGIIDVYLVDGLHNDLILGIDALSKGDGKIDPKLSLTNFRHH